METLHQLMFMENVCLLPNSNNVVAKEGVEKARASIAKMINAKPSEILFLSGGLDLFIL